MTPHRPTQRRPGACRPPVAGYAYPSIFSRFKSCCPPAALSNVLAPWPLLCHCSELQSHCDALWLDTPASTTAAPPFERNNHLIPPTFSHQRTTPAHFLKIRYRAAACDLTPSDGIFHNCCSQSTDPFQHCTRSTPLQAPLPTVSLTQEPSCASRQDAIII